MSIQLFGFLLFSFLSSHVMVSIVKNHIPNNSSSWNNIPVTQGV